MWARLRRWRDGRIIARSPLTPGEWADAFARLPLLDRLTDAERVALRELAILFLHRKQLHGVGSVSLSRDMTLVIALQACLPILKLGLDWYDGWTSVLVYPDDFAVQHDEVDEAGVVHRVRRSLSGEAWQDGPVILSWNDVYHAGAIDGHNLVIHEFAHKLDMRNGVANGFPPLHGGMSAGEWSRVFSQAFADFQVREQHHRRLPFDGYAAESPAEFFAVLSEVFFERPDTIHTDYPAVYAQLRDFYRQDPLSDMAGPGRAS